ncbi:SGNH/GDSL hydrolase family protein [Vibrio parahaemolyticus]
MHPLRNGSQVSERPARKPVVGSGGWFTESGENNVPSYPGQDWFNQCIQEFLSGLAELGITFNPDNEDHLAKAFKFLNDKIDSNSDDLSSLFAKLIPKSEYMYSRVNIERGGSAWGNRVVNLLGDSISHGAYANELYWNGYTQILRRMLNIEYGKTNWGFVSILDKLGNQSDPDNKWSQDIHDVAFVGSWAVLDAGGTSDNGGSGLINGYGRRSSTTADHIDISVPVYTKNCRIWYDRVDGGGQFEVYINGVLNLTVNTDSSGGASGGYFWTGDVALKDAGLGKCNIELRVVGDGPVTIQGVSYINDYTDIQFNNFSQSGRRLRWCDESIIEKSIAGATDFILALGHNDAGSSETDPSYAAEFSKRIDWVIQHANDYGTKVYLLDFNWTRSLTSHVRAEIRRASEQINNSTLISFPEFFHVDESIPTSSYLINTLKLFKDGSHPSIRGHQIIAEVIAKVMGLSCSSKQDANRSDLMWIPFDLSASSGLNNTFPSNWDLISAWRINGTNLDIRGYVSLAAGGDIPSGNYTLIDSFDFDWIPQSQKYTVRTAPATVKDASSSDITLEVVSSSLEVLQGHNGIRLIAHDHPVPKSNFSFLMSIPLNTGRSSTDNN